MLKTNFHTHTTFCDGKSSPEEIVLSAIDKGFDVLGFSGHSYTPFDESYCMSLENTEKYRGEIHRLKEKYRDRITILCGIEQDYYSNQPTTGYDYVIGSVHAFYKVNPSTGEGRYIYVDWDADTLKNAVRDIYGGDCYGLAEDYFSVVSDVVSKTGCNIIGHFDLLTKFNEKEPVFDVNHPRYEAAAHKALDKLMNTGAVFEINTGAMSKGYRTFPYPAENLLKKICRDGGKIILSSDSHHASTLDFAFDEALRLAKGCGFKSIMTLDKRGFLIEEQL